MSSKVSLSVALSVSLSVYLYLVYLAGSLFVTQPSLSPCLSIGFSAASISQPQQRMYLPHCVSRYLSLCPNCCCCYSQCSWPFFTLHLSQSPPSPMTRRLPICSYPRCNHMHCQCLCAVGACPKLQPVSGAANKQTKIKIPTTTTKTTTNDSNSNNKQNRLRPKNLTRLQWKKRQKHNGGNWQHNDV